MTHIETTTAARPGAASIIAKWYWSGAIRIARSW